jgi:hypothetical protein
LSRDSQTFNMDRAMNERIKLHNRSRRNGKSSILKMLKNIEGVEVVDNNDGSFKVNLKTKATIQDNRYSTRIKL